MHLETKNMNKTTEHPSILELLTAQVKHEKVEDVEDVEVFP